MQDDYDKIQSSKMKEFVDDLQQLCKKHQATIETYQACGDDAPVVDVTIEGNSKEGYYNENEEFRFICDQYVLLNF